MPRSCAVYGCTNTGDTGKEDGRVLKFYQISSVEWRKERMNKWIAFVNRKNRDGTPWKPSPWSKICSDHFVGGKKSEHPSSPSYVPTIPPRNPSKRRTVKLCADKSYYDVAIPTLPETTEPQSVQSVEHDETGDQTTATVKEEKPSEIIVSSVSDSIANDITTGVTAVVLHNQPQIQTNEKAQRALLRSFVPRSSQPVRRKMKPAKCATASGASSCLICTAKILPKIASTPNRNYTFPTEDDPKKLLALFCDCVAVDLSNLKVRSKNTFMFCTMCSAYLKEWSVAQQDISKLILRSSQVKATLLSRLLESSSRMDLGMKKIHKREQKSELGCQIRALISKQFSIKVRLWDFRQAKIHESSKRSESESPTDDEGSPDFSVESDKPKAEKPPGKHTKFRLKQEQDSDLDERVEERLTSEAATQTEDSEFAPTNSSSYGTRRHRRVRRRFSPSEIKSKQPRAERSIKNKDPTPLQTKLTGCTGRPGKGFRYPRKKRNKPRGVIMARRLTSSTYRGLKFVIRNGIYECCKCKQTFGWSRTAFRRHVDEEYRHNPQCRQKNFFPGCGMVTHVSENKYLYRGKLPFTCKEGKYQCKICLREFWGDPMSQQNQLVEHFETRHRNSLLYSAGPLHHAELEPSPGSLKKPVDLNITPAQIGSDSSISQPPTEDLVQVKLECPEESQEMIEVKSEPSETCKFDVNPLMTSCPPTAPKRFILTVPTVPVNGKQVPVEVAVLRSVPFPTITPAESGVPLLQESSESLTKLGRPEAVASLNPLDTSGWTPPADPFSVHVSQDATAAAATILPDISEFKTAALH